MISSIALAVATLLAPALAQDVVSQMSAVLGDQDLTATTFSSTAYGLTVVTNSSHALFRLEGSSSPANTGWFGLGFGTAMANSDMIVAWPKTDGTWAISHRTAAGEQMPTAVGNTATSGLYSVVESLSSDSSASTAFVTIARPLTFPDGATPRTQYVNLDRTASTTNIIHSMSSTKPNGDDADTAIMRQHNTGTEGPAQIDISTPYTAGSTNPVAGSGATVASYDINKRHRYIIAHAVFGSIAWMIFAPLAVILARFGRSFFAAKWFRMHAGLQMLTVICTIIAFGLGVYLVQPGPSFQDTHQRIGLALFILVLVQGLLGGLTHAVKRGLVVRRGPSGYLHIVLGIALLGLGFAQVWYGFTEEEDYYAPKSVKIIYWILIGLWAGLWLLGLLLVPKQVKSERERIRNREMEGEKVKMSL